MKTEVLKCVKWPIFGLVVCAWKSLFFSQHFNTWKGKKLRNCAIWYPNVPQWCLNQAYLRYPFPPPHNHYRVQCWNFVCLLKSPNSRIWYIEFVAKKLPSVMQVCIPKIKKRKRNNKMTVKTTPVAVYKLTRAITPKSTLIGKRLPWLLNLILEFWFN